LQTSFSEERIRDPKLKSLMKKIHLVPDYEIDALFTQVKHARITITVKSG